jgi:hypothetical protein
LSEVTDSEAENAAEPASSNYRDNVRYRFLQRLRLVSSSVNPWVGLQLRVYITPKLALLSKTETVEAPLK